METVVQVDADRELCLTCESSQFEQVPYPAAGVEFKDLKFKSILVCKHCGFGRVNPMPTQLMLDRFYEQGSFWASASEDVYLSAHHNVQAFYRAKWATQASKVASRVRVLDIGAGKGTLLEALRSRLGRDFLYHFVEPDAHLSKQILARGRAKAVRVKKLDVAPTGYHLIFLNHVLEHVENPVLLLGLISQKLAHDGVLYVEVPHSDYKTKDNVFPHTLFFTEASLKSIALKAGYRVVAVESFGHDPAQATKAMLGFKIASRLRWSWGQRFFGNAVFKYNQSGDGIWLRAVLRKS